MNRRQFILTSGVSALALVAPACPPRMPPSQQVKVARAFCYIPISLLPIKQISDVLVAEKTLTAETRNKVKAISDKSMEITSKIEVDVEAEKFDQATRDHWETLLIALIQEFNDVLRIANPDLHASWAEWLRVASETIVSIKTLVDELRPPADQKSALLAKQAKEDNAQGITSGGVSLIVAYSSAAAIKFIAVTQDDDVKSLWARFHRYSAEFKGQTSPTIAPVKKPAKKGK